MSTIEKKKECTICQVVLGNKYRSLKTESSQVYVKYLKELEIKPEGYLCFSCINKINRLTKVDEDIINQVEKLKSERAELLRTLRLIGKKATFVTPKKGPKRCLSSLTPSPRQVKQATRSATTTNVRVALSFGTRPKQLLDEIPLSSNEHTNSDEKKNESLPTSGTTRIKDFTVKVSIHIDLVYIIQKFMPRL